MRLCVFVLEYIFNFLLRIFRDYASALTTLLDLSGSVKSAPNIESQSSDVFNFYTYLRTHPLVLRARLGHLSGADVSVAKQIDSQLTPAERRLYFHTATMHYKSGCALVALEVC